MTRFKYIVVLLPLLAAGCLADEEKPRPKLAYSPNFAQEGFKLARAPIAELNIATNATYNPSSLDNIEPAAGQGFVHEDTYPQEIPSRTSALDSDKIPDGCNIKDRFDRTETIAYQWGQNRIGFTHFGGINPDGGYLRYKLKFQPHQTSKERCKYKSSWQGLVGSTYNELYMRENNTVWDDVKEIRLEGESRLDTLLQQ